MRLTAVFVLVKMQILTACSHSVVEMSQVQLNEVLRSEGRETSKSFAFASYYTDHMVLQRAPKQAMIWGYSPSIGETIYVKVSNGDVHNSTVYMDPTYGYGVWLVKLNPVTSRSPFTITAVSKTATIQLTDVLFGDVWICSGQSNMQFVVKEAFNASEEIAAAKNYPDVRLFTVRDVNSSVPVPDLVGVVDPWTRASDGGVGQFSAVCWFYGRELFKTLRYPIGLIDTSWGGTAIEVWSSPDALARCGLNTSNFEEHKDKGHHGGILRAVPKSPSSTWNSMIYPLLNMTIYGTIWYQGEENTEVNTHKYNCTFPAMIDDWRGKFHNASGQTDLQFPFGFVQIGPTAADSPGLGYPEIRWHQTADYGYVPNPKMQHVFMAVAYDLTDLTSPHGSVHIRDKQDVAARLVLGGLNVAYKRDVQFQGPLPNTIEDVNMKITLKYSEKIKYLNMEGFEALCPVNNSHITFWTPIPVLMPLQTTSIVLYSGVCGEGMTVIGLRYNWRETPCVFKTCTVYSAVNPLLPGPPFIVYKNNINHVANGHTLSWKPSVKSSK